MWLLRGDQLFASAALLLHGCSKHQDVMLGYIQCEGRVDVQGTSSVTMLFVSE